MDKKLTLIQLYVNESGWWRAGAVFNASATPIQHAIDNATDGDSIFVWNGTYKENVTVNKHLTLEGEGMDVVRVEAVSSKGHVFEVTADCVHISGFTVTGATGSGKAGIYLRSDHCCISDNNASNSYYGIRLQDSSNNTLTNNTAKSNSEDGIYLDSSSHNKLTNNTANSNNWYGIHMAFSSNNTLANNTAKMNMLGGVWLSFSSNNTLTNNTANLNDGWGIFLLGSSTDMFFTSNNNTLTSNTANSNNWSGIYLHYSCDNTLKNNTISGNSYNFAVFGADLSHYIQYIDTSNHVDGKPVYYWVNQKDKHMPNDAGFVGIVNSTNITVRDLRLRNNSAGVLFAYTNNSRIENISVSNNGWGIRLRYSNDNMLKNSIAYSNNCGICMVFSSNNTLTNNIMSRNIRNFAVFGDALHHYIQNMDTSNFVDGKPIYYWFDQQNKQVSSDAGYVGIVNSTNITVRDLTLTNNSGEVLFAYTNNSVIDNASNNCVIRLYSSSNNTLTNNMGGIHLRNSSSNILTNNNASKNFFGIYLWNSSNNTLTNNIIKLNNVDGIHLCRSSNNTICNNNILNNWKYGIYLVDFSTLNKIYLNNFMNNSNNVYSSSSAKNIWNSTGKITYIYNENTHSNYLGNYWDDYTGSDIDKDGIGDTSYIIDSDKDNYPLMERFENYFAPVENIVNTGLPANLPHVSHACTTGITHYGNGGDRIRYKG